MKREDHNLLHLYFVQVGYCASLSQLRDEKVENALIMFFGSPSAIKTNHKALLLLGNYIAFSLIFFLFCLTLIIWNGFHPCVLDMTRKWNRYEELGDCQRKGKQQTVKEVTQSNGAKGLLNIELFIVMDVRVHVCVNQLGKKGTHRAMPNDKDLRM